MEPHYPPQHIRRRAARRRKQRRVLVFLLFASRLTGGWLLGRYADFIRAAAHPGVYAVAVDAGHGGSDTGAEGVIQESNMTAATAAALCALLEQDPHFIVVNTRADYNTGAKPDERAKAANAKHADLLLSIHGNADASPDTHGFECYPVTPGHRRHEASLHFAECLASEMESAGAHLRAKNGIRYAYYKNGNTKTLVDSSDDTVRSAPTFGILEHADCPAVLAEQCFVTSPADVDAFGDEDGCAAAAACYYRAICAYFGVKPAAAV